MATSNTAGGIARTILLILLTVSCFGLGLKLLQAFLIYSFQVGGYHGLAAYSERYSSGRLGQMTTLSLFTASQVAGGILILVIASRGKALNNQVEPWTEKLKWAFVSTCLFVVGTAISAAAIVKFSQR